jgi:1,4-dihydroxy-6-naphthoate synthase
MEENLHLCYSPCPNDTFIFYGIAHERIATEPFRFEIDLADVETLNQRAAAVDKDISPAIYTDADPEVCKVSANALTNLLDAYWILSSGGALGFGCGPLVVAREDVAPEALLDLPLAIPGRLTTAYLLYRLFAEERGGHSGPVLEMRYDQIMPALAAGDAAAGLIIHEGRFTYQNAGLRLVQDLGAWWEQSSGGAPLPLGVIVMKRELGREAALRMQSLIRQSIEYSRSRPEEAMDYIRAHAQELDDAVINQHIGAFVNELSLDHGEIGRKSLRLLLEKALRLEGRSLPDLPLFPA